MDFDVYGVRWADVEFERFLHRDVSGEYWERPVGYRFVIEAFFVPIQHDETKLVFMYSYFLGTNRRIVFSSESRNVAFVGDFLQTTYEEPAFFSDAFTLPFVERQVRYVVDDGSTTRILKPLYHSWDDSPAGQYFINWIDEDSIQLKKIDLEFVGGNRGDPTWAYQHAWEIDFGVIKDATKRTWLIEFCLWKSKQIDLSDVNPVLYETPISIVFADAELKFRWEDGIGEALAAKLMFYQKRPYTEAEKIPGKPWQLIEIPAPEYR